MAAHDVQQNQILPPEIERTIAERVYLDHPTSALTLLLVAKRFNIWLEPLIYRVFCLSSLRTYPSVYLTSMGSENASITSSNNLKPPPNSHLLNRFGHHTQSILFERVPVDHIVYILQHTPNISSLALWSIRGVLLALLPTLSSLPNLSTLSFDPSCFFMAYSEDLSIPFDLPLFRNIEELEIVNITPSFVKWQKLAEMPKLQRLALAGRASDELLDCILDSCSHMESLIVYTLDEIPSTLTRGSGGTVSVLKLGTNLVGGWEQKMRERIYQCLG
ncbi:hypothetical protein CPB83DRAFT_444011 [Crepidotus variabilis]|uniref:F-box domain-containing protein n=1 Tax=Crepidotus variabilis TaxID=179855 RepID=A0A9P6JNJ7_9AGAR|nr:hypothetical protein CPB83DRAFT_444011 [Crepidotus variabilis]